MEEKIETSKEIVPQEKAPALEAQVFIRLAEAYRLQGRYEEAIQTCQEGLEKMPDSLPGRMLLGRCFLEKSMIPQAKEELEKVVAEMEKCFSVYKWLSLVYLLEKNMDKALESLKKSLSLPSPEERPSKEIRTREGVALDGEPISRGGAPGVNLEETLQEIKKSAESEKPSPAAIRTDTLAEIYIKQGHLDRALSVYEEILTREPENAEVRGKYEGLKKRIEESRKASSQKKILSHLEQWLEAVSPKSDPESP